MSSAHSRRARRPGRDGGFTLIEVMVALAIVALGMSALLETLNVSAGNVAALRDKTVAEWIAMNKIADTRLTLNPPLLGTSEGDIDDCAHGTWHWRQDVTAVTAIPGLVSITVSVRRTGNAIPKDKSASQKSERGVFSGPATLGATRPLGSVTTLGVGSCIAAVAPGDSLGGPASLGLGAPASLGPASLGGSSLGGASPQLGTQSQAVRSLTGGPTSTSPGGNAGGAASGASGVFGSALSGPGAQSSGNSAGSNSSSSSNSTSSSSSSSSGGSNGPSWLVTLTGFRGNSLGAANGEMPNWSYSGFAGSPGANGPSNGTNPNGGGPFNNNGLNNGFNNGAGGSSGNGGFGPFQAPQTPGTPLP
jgi:type II secretion system protein I